VEFSKYQFPLTVESKGHVPGVDKHPGINSLVAQAAFFIG